jgi:dihydrolipoamide dehydrogenase
VSKTETYTRAYAESKGFLTLLADGQHLTGAYALGPGAGEWLQQATLAIRARVPIEVLRDTIQPFPTFSEITLRRSRRCGRRSRRRGSE